MWSTFTSTMELEFWVKTSVNKTNYNSFIYTNVKVEFEPCVLNLIQKCYAKDPKEKEDYHDFHELWSEKVCYVKDIRKKKFDV
jgi:hypothetical protein